ncbi:hypothetical protein ABVT39_005826 [Epinephelus coioides]
MRARSIFQRLHVHCMSSHVAQIALNRKRSAHSIRSHVSLWLRYAVQRSRNPSSRRGYALSVALDPQRCAARHRRSMWKLGIKEIVLTPFDICRSGTAVVRLVALKKRQQSGVVRELGKGTSSGLQDLLRSPATVCI